MLCGLDYRRSISIYSLGFAACVIWWLSVFLGAMQRDCMGKTSPHEKCMISRRLKEMDNHRFECMVSCLQNCYSCCRFLIIPDIQGSKTNLSLLTSKKSIRKARVAHLLEAVIHSGPMFKYFEKFPCCKSFDISDLSNTDIDRLTVLSASLDITSTTDIGPTRKSRHSHHRVSCNP